MKKIEQNDPGIHGRDVNAQRIAATTNQAALPANMPFDTCGEFNAIQRDK